MSTCWDATVKDSAWSSLKLLYLKVIKNVSCKVKNVVSSWSMRCNKRWCNNKMWRFNKRRRWLKELGHFFHCQSTREQSQRNNNLRFRLTLSDTRLLSWHGSGFGAQICSVFPEVSLWFEFFCGKSVSCMYLLYSVSAVPDVFLKRYLSCWLLFLQWWSQTASLLFLI